MFAYAKVNYSTFIRTSFEVAAFLYVSIVRHAEISGAADQHRQMWRECINDFATCHTRRYRLGIFEIRQMCFPVRRQFSTHHRTPLAPEIGVLLLVSFIQRFPFRFLLVRHDGLDGEADFAERRDCEFS